MSAKKTSTINKKKKVVTKKKTATKRKSKTSVKASPKKSITKKKTTTKRKSKTANKKRARKKDSDLANFSLPDGYSPSQQEEYMGPLQLLYFQSKLRDRRQELINQSQETLHNLKTEIRDVSDDAERASRESDNILELRTRDRYRKLLSKIDSALRRIGDSSYGYCEETGEEIGLARLEARPTATLTVDAQERREMLQRQFRDDR